MNHASILGAVVVLGFTVSSSFALQCYVCNSKNDTDCGSPPSERHLKNCDDLHYENNENGESFKVCRLQVMQSPTHGPAYDRRCGWKKHNENRETCILTPDPHLKATNCECHTEGCNTAVWTQPSMAVFWVFIAIGLIASRRGS
ncbi:uncharacterized protein LOC100905489 [Galendromus occidentalis]|uniref:Uncharacterized protein LOC100905489 n=1 Tax=Galendromus occidentalis TaxID=34638 RepID=A0AAJ6VYA5_9ACAR|nr:uncharacterized protein LOC100905489 [Galendromus occidentalis]